MTHDVPTATERPQQGKFACRFECALIGRGNKVLVAVQKSAGLTRVLAHQLFDAATRAADPRYCRCKAYGRWHHGIVLRVASIADGYLRQANNPSECRGYQCVPPIWARRCSAHR